VAVEGSLMIDVSRLVARTAEGRLPTGVDRICLEYVKHFGERSQAVVRWGAWRRIADYRTSQSIFELLADPGRRFRAQLRRIVARACVPPWPAQEGNGRIYLNPGHSGLDDAGTHRWLASTRQRPVFTVADLIPLKHPEYCRPGESERHEQRMKTVLRSGAGVLAISQDTLDELRDFARFHGIGMPPAVSAPIAPAPLAFDRRLPPPIAQPYFVVLGTIEPRKNHLLLLHVWRSLAEQLGSAAPHLVVIGQRGWECENVVDLLERCEALRGLVHEKNRCTDDELARWLGHARALLFPSFAEGYGMPLVEALMLGTPALATPLPAFREAAGEVPEYVDALDGLRWRDLVLDYAAPGSARRQAQLARIASWSMPTWASHFDRVESLLEELG
jgi:glycosyltransferase involved in cell wall biosynthesis